MDIFDLLKEVVKGVVRAITAHLLQKHILDKENATQRAVASMRVALAKIICDKPHLYG